MTEKTEANVKREKDMVSSMRNAQANMTASFKRIETLESTLAQLIVDYESTVKWLPDYAYPYDDNKSCRDTAKHYINNARRML